FALVVGEAGIGKTRLVDELIEWAARQGVATAVARCYAVGGRLAYAPVQEWLRAPTFRRAHAALESGWVNEVARLLPELINGQPHAVAPNTNAALTDGWQRRRLFEALARLVFHNGEPLLLVLDDVQWCDDDTLEWVQYLLRFNSKARLLIVGALRREEVSGERALTPFLRHLRYANQLVEIELPRLAAAETAQLATTLLGRTIDPGLAARLHADTEGNPLFVVEMVREQASRTDKETRGNSPSPSHPLPPKVQAVIKARLDRLTLRTTELAGVAAVIGRAFAVDVLTQASDSDEESLVQGLDELWQQQIIREQANGTAGADVYDFTHDKLREVAYSSLSPIRRRHLHRRIAQALETLRAANLDGVSDQIALHYERAGGAAQAIRYYRRAAALAHRLSALQEAIAHLTSAVALLPLLPEGAERAGLELALQMALGPLLLTTQGYAAPGVEQAFNRAWALVQPLGDPVQRFQVLWGLGRFYLVQPNLARGLDAGQQLLAIAQRAEEPSLLIEAYNSVGAYSFHRGALTSARRYLEAGIELYDRVEHRDHALLYGQDPGVVCLTRVAWALWCLGYPQAAAARVQAALALAHELAHPYSQVVALTYAAAHSQFSGDAAACRTQAEAAITLATQHGFTLWLAMVAFLRGWALTQQGEMPTGLAEMQQFLTLYRRTGAELGAAYYVALLADAQGRAGQPELALTTIGEAFSLLEKTEDRWCEAELYRLHGELLRQTGDDASAETAFERALDVAQAQQARLWQLRAAVSLGRLWQAQGKTADAHTHLSEIYAWFKEGFDTPDLVAAKALLSRL
ncbi:MAG: AAA family ATPase, partial [Chloroflexota bacterium]|nr:AAA family ATPase [Chloroflexota bacterium]